MSTPHLQPGEVTQALDAAQSARAQALFKGVDLEVMRLVLPAGSTLPGHAAPGEATLLCLQGRLTVGLAEGMRELMAGQMLYLGRAMRHDVTALADSVVLVTLALPSQGSK